MIIVPTFNVQNRPAPCNLWSVCYPEDGVDGEAVDIFTKLFDQWNDTTYLQNFLSNNISDLSLPIWKNISVDRAIDQIQDEANDFANELEGIELQLPGYEGKTVTDIFESFHSYEIVLKQREERFRKGRPDFNNPMLRLYGIELENSCIVITGGAIKLTRKMDRPHLEHEIARLKRVQDYLNSQHIYSREGLEQL